MGLLFVSLSIHLDKIVHERGAHLEAMAREAFASFVIVLALSLMMLAPPLAQRPLGVSLLVLSVARGTMTIRRMRRTLGPTARSSGFGGGNMVLRFLFPLMAALFLAWAGVRFLNRQPEEGLVGIMTSALLLIADATRSSYELLIRTARGARAPVE